MWLPSANLFVPTLQRVISVHPGSMIGRLASADVCIQDPRVSEAHALVSLRAGALRLLALRGRLFLGGRELDSISLTQGQMIGLTEGVDVFVEDVKVPSHAIMLCGVEDGPAEISGNVYSLIQGRTEERIRLVAEYDGDALGHIWHTAEVIWIRLGDGAPEPLKPGSKWAVRGAKLHAVEIPLAGVLDTSSGRVNEVEAPLTIRARFTSVHIQRVGRETAVISGKPAALLSELVRFGCKSVPWEVLAREVWKDCEDRILLRQSWDRALGRLREQLRQANVRDSLISPDGTGNVDLVLGLEDVVIDET